MKKDETQQTVEEAKPKLKTKFGRILNDIVTIGWVIIEIIRYIKH